MSAPRGSGDTHPEVHSLTFERLGTLKTRGFGARIKIKIKIKILAFSKLSLKAAGRVGKTVL